MVVADVPGMNPKRFPNCDVLEHSFQLLFNILVPENLSTVFGTPDDVVVANPFGMRLLVESSVHK